MRVQVEEEGTGTPLPLQFEKQNKSSLRKLGYNTNILRAKRFILIYFWSSKISGSLETVADNVSLSPVTIQKLTIILFIIQNFSESRMMAKHTQQIYATIKSQTCSSTKMLLFLYPCEFDLTVQYPCEFNRFSIQQIRSTPNPHVM